MEYEVKESFFEGCRNKVVVDRGCGRWRLRLMEEEGGRWKVRDRGRI
jgi:hypothetical protein